MLRTRHDGILSSTPKELAVMPGPARCFVRALRPMVVAGLVAVNALGPSAAANGQVVTERISVSSAGVQANALGSWWYLAPMVAFSRDGSLVAFSSDATNLVRRDRNRASDVFVRNRVSGITKRVSLTASGRPGNDLSF